jgi:chemotaxis family two-component system response regulator PixG
MSNETDTGILNKLRKALDKLINEKATGKIVLATEEVISEIYILTGRLVYVVDKAQRMRRWERAVKKNCPNWEVPAVWSDEQPWEFALLAQGISKKQLTLKQVKAVIEQVIEECFLELGYYQQIKYLWKAQEMTKSALAYCLTLSAADIHPLLTHIEEEYAQDQKAGLGKIKPSLSPVLISISNDNDLPFNKHYLNGELTVWDIAFTINKPVAEVSKSLLHLLQKGLIKLQTLPDLPAKAVVKNAAPPPKTTPVVGGHQIVIACIDDSAVVTHNLQKILAPAGYKVLSIPEPMAGFAELIEHKPSLILLDLNLPNANGYSICKFLRETPVFGKTPIIILTSQDTVIDRSRAKIVGATDFIAKPPQPEQLLQMIQKYLSQKAEVPATN